MTGVDQVRSLLEAVVDRRVKVGDFCASLEHWWNFERTSQALSAEQARVVEQVLDVAARYSPFFDEQQMPVYRNDDDVIRAAELGLTRL